jgi:hypothetical protein
MPRDILAETRASLEEPEGEDQPFVFITIEHEDIDEPIRVVSDTGTENGEPVTFEWDGDSYIAMPFEIELLSDNEGPPRGRITIQDVDRDAGEAIRGLLTPAEITITVIPTSEFDLTVNPRTEVDTAVPAYGPAGGITIRNIQGDALQITGDLVSIDDTREPWPSLRATQALLPGLYR